MTRTLWLEKYSPLVQCWQSVEQLSLEELMFPQRWDTKIEGPVSIAAILDVLFRDHQYHALHASVVDVEDCEMNEPETPWIEVPAQFEPKVHAQPLMLHFAR